MHVETRPTLLDQDSAAEVIGVSPHTLRGWRCQQKGPPYRKIGSRCLYEERDVLEWIASQPKHNVAG